MWSGADAVAFASASSQQGVIVREPTEPISDADLEQGVMCQPLPAGGPAAGCRAVYCVTRFEIGSVGLCADVQLARTVDDLVILLVEWPAASGTGRGDPTLEGWCAAAASRIRAAVRLPLENDGDAHDTREPIVLAFPALPVGQRVLARVRRSWVEARHSDPSGHSDEDWSVVVAVISSVAVITTYGVLGFTVTAPSSRRLEGIKYFDMIPW